MSRLRQGLAWLWDVLRPSHWQDWPDWLRDWYGLRRHNSRKALARRLTLQRDRILALEGKMDELFEIMRFSIEAAGLEYPEPDLVADQPPAKPERHLHLVGTGGAS